MDFTWYPAEIALSKQIDSLRSTGNRRNSISFVCGGNRAYGTFRQEIGGCLLWSASGQGLWQSCRLQGFGSQKSLSVEGPKFIFRSSCFDL